MPTFSGYMKPSCTTQNSSVIVFINDSYDDSSHILLYVITFNATIETFTSCLPCFVKTGA